MRLHLLFSLVFVFALSKLSAQGFPWERPLKMAWSADGITFGTPSVFQDSSGVPSVVRWKGDTLVCAFQWFRVPVSSVSWDKVAVKFSYDNGMTWTDPEPIIVNGLPVNYQRPFDPTLLALNNDSIRIYFSSSDGLPGIGLDSTVNTYSASSTDGIHFTFETDARVDELSNRVIDPAVIRFKNGYHYISPIGSPQQGAYHYISPDGLNFMKVPDIPSDNNHNWTGNYMMKDTGELRFYGCGQAIWYKATANGGIWNGYVHTNIQGGDPSVVRTGLNSYLMVYVGNPYAAISINEVSSEMHSMIFPNPAANQLHIQIPLSAMGSDYRIVDLKGVIIKQGKLLVQNTIMDIGHLSAGTYAIIIGQHDGQTFKWLKE